MTEIPALYGQVGILSFASVSNPLVGITYQGESFATVSLGQTEQIWNITTQPSGNGLRFSIGEYLYTGLDNGVTVIATNEVSQDVAWSSTVNDLGEYTIYPLDDSNKAWTVQDSTASGSPIILDSRNGSPSQVFKAQPD